MEIRIYDKDGNVIAEDRNNEGNDHPGHYDFNLSGSRNGIEFVKKKSKKSDDHKNTK